MALTLRSKIVPVRDDPRIILKGDLIDRLWTVFTPRWKRGLPNYCLVSDAAYYKPTRAVAQKIALAWAKKRPRYVADRYDCDDYAWALKAHFSDLAARDPKMPFGYALGIMDRGFAARSRRPCLQLGLHG
jgi:hypothetical protein